MTPADRLKELSDVFSREIEAKDAEISRLRGELERIIKTSEPVRGLLHVNIALEALSGQKGVS